MCGGIGSRFWPYSRSSRPKQFIDFLGTGRTLLQMSFDRILPLVPKENVLIVTNEQYAPLVREQLPELAESQILLEPARRNTAPCIAWAAYHIAAIDPEASIIVAPSDHLITRENIFVDSLERGFRFVETHDALLTLGIRPSRPETGYGYIQVGQPVDGVDGICKVKTRAGAGICRVGRILLEFRYFPMVGKKHHPRTRAARPQRGRSIRERNRCVRHSRRAKFHRAEFPRLPQYLD